MKRFLTQQLIITAHFVKAKLFCWTTVACFAFTLLNLSNANAQAADAVNAIQICDGIWPEPSAAASTGSVNDLPNATAKGCLAQGEHGSNWYFVKVMTNGVMAFSIQGVKSTGTAADIDGSVFGPFASPATGAASIVAGTSAPIRCSYAGNNLGIELRPGVAATSDLSTGVVNAVNVTIGQYYLIYIDNFDAGTANGAVAISWSFTVNNTATYGCPPIPATCGPSCSAATCPVADLGIFAAKGIQTAGTFTATQCYNYSPTPFKAGDGTFNQCYTVNSDAYGNLGVVQTILIRGSDANNDGISDSTPTILASRKATLTLASSPCGLTIAASRTNGGNSGTFNPEWDNLTPNTSYILCIATTMPLAAVTKAFNYRQSCVDVYHYVPSPVALYPACATPAPKWWYKANAGISTSTNGAPINFWNDQSPNAYNVTQTGAARPTFNTNGINFNPSLSFNGAQNLFKAATVGLTATNKTILSVAVANILPAGTVGIIGSGTTLNEIQYGYQGGKLNVYENVLNNGLATTANAASSVMLSSFIENANNYSFFNNGVANGTAFFNSSPTGDRLTIGSHNASGSDKNFFNGQIAEIIVFDRAVTATERLNAESYLAIKYGVTLGHDYTNSIGTVLYPIASFANRITVIGREDCQNLNQKQSKSVNAGNWTIGLQTVATNNALNTNTFSTNNTFLALGDDNASMTAAALTPSAACAPPVGTDVEVPRHWKMVETGTMDSVLMQIPTAAFAGLDLTQPVYVVIADDAAFMTNPHTFPLTKNGSNYEKKLLPNGTQYLKIIGTGIVTTYCTGFNYLQWSANPWTAGALTKTTPLSNGLSVTTTVGNPNGIMLAGYPKMVGTQPVMFISSNSAAKIVTWSMQFNKTVTGAGFYLYDVDHIGALNENIQITGYKGATAILPTLSKTATSFMVLNNVTATASGGNNNFATYNPAARVLVSFNAAIDKIVITYKNNSNTFRNTTAALAIGDLSIYCPEPVVEPDLVSLKKIAPTAAVHQGDTISYTFKVNNVDCAAKTIDITDNLPTGMTWVDDSYTSTLSSGTLNTYGGTTAFSLSSVLIPVGVSTFTVDAVAGVSGTKNNQATFLINGHTYPSDDPNQNGTTDVTPLSISAPLTTPPVTITKSVATPVLSSTGTQTFTYTINNVGATPITMDFTDELVADTMTYVATTLSTTLGGTALAYAGEGSLFINGMTVPVGISTFTVQVAMNNLSANTYQNTATLIATGAAYTPNVIASNTATWSIAPPASFGYAFNCSGSSVSGTFIADGIANQMGTITIPINVVNAGLVTLTVAGTNFMGTLTTAVVAGQSVLTIPIVYSGAGIEGSRLLTISSAAGTGVCSVLVQIQAGCKANGGRIGQ